MDRDRDLTVPSPQAVPVPNSKVPGRSAVYRNVLSQHDITKVHLAPPIQTAFEGFETGCRNKPNHPCLGHREQDPATGTWGPYLWETYEEIRARRNHFGSGLMNIYRDVVKGTKESQFCVGIIAANRKEWVLTDLACQAHSLIAVGLYDTLGPDSTAYVVNLTEMEMMVVSIDNIPKLLTIKDTIPTLKVIICMDSEKTPKSTAGSKLGILQAWGKSKGVYVTDFASVESLGKEKPVPLRIPSPNDIFAINFTSGTTGNPKGAVLTHANAATGCMSPLAILKPHSAEKDEYILSFLPLSHIFERINFISSFYQGASVGLYHGVILEILDDIQALKPTILVAVPRLLLRMEMAIKAKTILAPGFKGALSRRALATKYARMDAGGDQYHPLWDRLWSRKVKEALGGRIELIISGSAPLPKDTIRFLKAALACEVIEGFGMTETTSSGCVGHPGDKVVGHVGPPVPNCEIVLEDVPSMNYTSQDKPFPRGELLIRGGMRLREYYKEKGKTDEAIDKDGWLHTGDVAQIDNEGRVYIIDRVKNIFKLSQGEYVAAERLEAMYASCNLVAQIFVHGDSTQSYLVAVVGVDPVNFANFISAIVQKEVQPADVPAHFNDTRIRKAVVAELDQVAKQRGLAGFEKVKNVHLTLEPFSVENDCLTPSFKLKRPNALQTFRKEIDKLYAETGSLIQPLAKL
jgi:long-chain acyl-CoA synthetase